MACKEFLIKVSPTFFAALQETANDRNKSIPDIIEEGVRLRLALNKAKKKNQRVIIDGDNILVEPGADTHKA